MNINEVQTKSIKSLRGVKDAPSGYGEKFRNIRNNERFWRKKGWQYHLPATNLPGRWAKEIGEHVVWAIGVKPISRTSSMYWFQRRKDHGFRRHSIGRHREALKRRSSFRLMKDNNNLNNK